MLKKVCTSSGWGWEGEGRAAGMAGWGWEEEARATAEVGWGWAAVGTG